MARGLQDDAATLSRCDGGSVAIPSAYPEPDAKARHAMSATRCGFITRNDGIRAAQDEKRRSASERFDSHIWSFSVQAFRNLVFVLGLTV